MKLYEMKYVPTPEVLLAPQWWIIPEHELNVTKKSLEIWENSCIHLVEECDMPQLS
jgi:hypothetical protein